MKNFESHRPRPEDILHGTRLEMPTPLEKFQRKGFKVWDSCIKLKQEESQGPLGEPFIKVDRPTSPSSSLDRPDESFIIVDRSDGPFGPIAMSDSPFSSLERLKKFLQDAGWDELPTWENFNPREPSDMRPVKYAAEKFEENHQARWERTIANDSPDEKINFWDFIKAKPKRKVSLEEYQKLCRELTQVASEDLEGRKIYRLFSYEDFIRALDNNYIPSTHEKYKDTDHPGKIRTYNHMSWLQLSLSGYPLDTPDDQRPIHGIATYSNFGEFNHKKLGFFSQDFALFFDDNIADYSTVTGGDSITLCDEDKVAIYASPAVLRKPTYKIFSLVKEYDTDMTIWDPRDYRKKPDKMPNAYFEVQMHRFLMKEPLMPQKHGTRAVCGYPERLGEEKTREIKRKLDEKYPHIKFDVGTSEEDSTRLRKEVPWIKNMFAGSS